jgi:hypothetical protein
MVPRATRGNLMSSKPKGRVARRAPRHAVALGKTHLLTEMALASRISAAPADSGASSLLDKREKSHGAFADVARVAQALRDTMRSGPAWARMSDVQREALESKATKLARMCCGDPGHVDHWRDDIGYAEQALAGGAPRPSGDGPAKP